MNRVKRKSYPNGVTTDFTYNENSWLTGLAASGASPSSGTYNYGYDGVGNITSITAGQDSWSYQYDSTYQILKTTSSAKTESFTYDGNGNRLSREGSPAEWVYNKDNELISSDSASFSYDANGNVITKTDGAGTTTFIWDSRDRLTKVQLPDGSFTTFSYDAVGRRIAKTYNTTENGAPVDTRWVYFYDDAAIALEIYTDPTGRAETTFYIEGAGIDEHLAFERSGQFFYYLSDHLRNVVAISDDNANIVQHYDLFCLSRKWTFRPLELRECQLVLSC